jgi:hypothetical protein
VKRKSSSDETGIACSRWIDDDDDDDDDDNTDDDGVVGNSAVFSRLCVCVIGNWAACLSTC